MIVRPGGWSQNASSTRDPDMHQTKKGNQWYFGMKAHLGVDAGTGYAHTVTATAANVIVKRDFTKTRYRGIAKNG